MKIYKFPEVSMKIKKILEHSMKKKNVFLETSIRILKGSKSFYENLENS